MENFLPAELELQRRPPRNVQNRGGTAGALKPYWIFLLPHVWIAVAAPFVLAHYAQSYFAAEPFAGKVLAHDTYTSSKGAKTYDLKPEIQVDGKSYSSECSVDQSLYDSVKDGDSVSVYALRSDPAHFNRIGNDAFAFRGLAIGALWVVAWCGGIMLMVYSVLAQPLRSKKLVKSGIPVQGKLDELKQSKTRNGKFYTALYSFPYRQLDPKTGRTELTTIQGKMKVGLQTYLAAEDTVGKEVTVLIDEKNPKCNIIYQYCDHKAI